MNPITLCDTLYLLRVALCNNYLILLHGVSQRKHRDKDKSLMTQCSRDLLNLLIYPGQLSKSRKTRVRRRKYPELMFRFLVHIWLSPLAKSTLNGGC
jgi:hypothetical protein